MRRLCLLPVVAVAVLALPGAAQASLRCNAEHGGVRFCHVNLGIGHEATVGRGYGCYAKRIFANDHSSVADASADAAFVAPHTIHMLNDIWSHHAKYGPLSVYGYFLSGHRMKFDNRSRFAVTVFFTRHCH